MRIRIALALLPLLGCTRLPPLSVPPAIDPGVNLAAHLEHERIVADRLPGGARGVLEQPSWFRWGRAPTFVLQVDGQPAAYLWLTAPATVEVRTTSSPDAPVVGAVEPGWDDNAIRLTLRAGDAVFHTDTFARTDVGGGPPVLSRIAQSVIDVRGTYRAPVRDAKNAEVGWLRVKVSPYQEALRIFDGVVPAGVGASAAGAIAVALNSEVDWIESHTLDVYRGSDGGPLRQSIPMGR